MSNTCKNCRFYNCKKCFRFSIDVNENYTACNDYAEKKELNESVKQKMQLND